MPAAPSTIDPSADGASTWSVPDDDVAMAEDAGQRLPGRLSPRGKKVAWCIVAGSYSMVPLGLVVLIIGELTRSIH